jgi:hypothetical protein
MHPSSACRRYAPLVNWAAENSTHTIRYRAKKFSSPTAPLFVTSELFRTFALSSEIAAKGYSFDKLIFRKRFCFILASKTTNFYAKG